MSGETKSKGRKDLYDRFYTPIETARQCLELLNLQEYDCIVEPAAGTGNFYTELKKQNNNVFAFDIAPAHEEILNKDFLTLDFSQLKDYNNILVCGNPPFGQQNNLAIKFFNKAAQFANTIAFILPLSFKKTSIQNKLDLSFHLINEIILGKINFEVYNQDNIEVPCVFQVWQKQENKRIKKQIKKESDLIRIVKKEEADFRIQRVGGNAGRAFLDLDKAESSNYFIKNISDKTNEELIDYINSITFPTLEFTVGPKSLSKEELFEYI